MKREEWKRVPDYEDYYEVSNFGNVRSLDRIDACGRLRKGKKLSPANVRGQLKVILTINSKSKMIGIHQLVAMAFLGHTRCGYELVVDHIDNNPLNNRLDNIQIITSRLNSSKDKKNKTSRFTGVSWNKQKRKWISQLNIGFKKIYLGQFDCELAAAYTYNQKIKEL